MFDFKPTGYAKQLDISKLNEIAQGTFGKSFYELSEESRATVRSMAEEDRPLKIFL